MEAFVGFLILILTAIAYFLPTVIAVVRKHRNALAVFLLNLFLGWTLFGWVGALVWSVLAQAEDKTHSEF
jgi:hypothetical protein